MASQTKARPMETSFKYGIFLLKKRKLSKSKSRPAVIPKPNSCARMAASVYGLIAISLLE